MASLQGSVLLGQEPATGSLAGSWVGDLKAGNQTLRPVFRVIPDGEGGWKATVDDEVQRFYGLPVSLAQVEADGTVRLEVAMTAGTFSGKFTEDGNGLEGTWKQRGGEFPLSLERTDDLPAVSKEVAGSLAGHWKGLLQVSGVELRLVLNLESPSTGGLEGTLDSPDQGANGIPISRVDALEGKQVRICVGAVLANFVGELQDPDTFKVHMFQGGGRFPLTMKRVEQVEALPRPQTPKAPFPYSIHEVEYQNEVGGITLAGTLTVPNGEGPFPAVLLITGSGAQDRDETIFEHKPFWVIADHLSRAGIAALRVDDRGVGGSSGGETAATSADLATDVAAGVAFLRQRPKIDPKRIGLIGHSEGGLIAPMVAAEDAQIAFLVLLAGPGTTGRQILVDQTELIGRAAGTEESMLKENRRLQNLLFDLILDENLDPAEAEKQMIAAMKSSPAYAGQEAEEAAIERALGILRSPWMRYFLAHDPVPVLEKVKCPVLALNGTLDLQVPFEANLAGIAEALERGGNSDFLTTAWPKLNHLFQHAETGLVTEYGKIEETFAPQVLEQMTDWIQKRIQAKD